MSKRQQRFAEVCGPAIQSRAQFDNRALQKADDPARPIGQVRLINPRDF